MTKIIIIIIFVVVCNGGRALTYRKYWSTLPSLSQHYGFSQLRNFFIVITFLLKNMHIYSYTLSLKKC